MAYNLLGGGLMLGAIFMATDYATSPVTKKGQIIYGIGCGALTVFIRYFGSYVEGVSYAILIMNVCVWLIDKVTLPRQFGVSKEDRAVPRSRRRKPRKRRRRWLRNEQTAKNPQFHRAAYYRPVPHLRHHRPGPWAW